MLLRYKARPAEMSNRNRLPPERRQLAYEAARIMAEQGIGEFERARRKAAERTGITNRRFWPNNEEIKDALLAQRRLFDGEHLDAELHRLRSLALAAMRDLAVFEPRLVGSVLNGVADGRQGVRLHLFADSPEDVVLTLLDRGIPWREREDWLRFAGGARRAYPVLTFLAGDTPFELVVLPRGTQRNPPLDPVTERPERGADATEVARLQECNGQIPGPCC